jgi:hypothetical protein
MEWPEFDPLFRWFVGIGVDDAAWDHSVFSEPRTPVGRRHRSHSSRPQRSNKATAPQAQTQRPSADKICGSRGAAGVRVIARHWRVGTLPVD